MKAILSSITDRVATRKGMWIVLALWLAGTIILAGTAPGASEYKSTVPGSGLPDEAKSVIAAGQLEEYFSGDEGLPALLVLSEDDKELQNERISAVVRALDEAQIKEINSIVPYDRLPPQVQKGFQSEDGSTAVIPVLLNDNLEAKVIQTTLETMEKIAIDSSEASFVRITGPAGISSDAVALFSRADVVLLLSTVGLIFVLLIVIYRSPLLVFIPLIACAIVYLVVDKTVGLMGYGGLSYSSQTTSIMAILLFASVTDYSLFVFARYREELKRHESKFEAMKTAMREIGEPVFFSGGTVLAAMLVLFAAVFQGYREFAPVFSAAMAVIMLASITLVPALFQLFGRKAFWPKVPKLGEDSRNEATIWNGIGKFVSARPKAVAATLMIVFVVTGLNTLNMNFQFDSLGSFPKDMPSREGYERLEQYFPKGDLAPTSIIVKSDSAVPEENLTKLIALLNEQDEVNKVTMSDQAENGKIIKLSMSFKESPYSVESLNAIDEMRDREEQLLADAGVAGELHFSGETAKQADVRSVSNRDTWTVIALETVLILLLLWVLTRSLKASSYMMATILISYASALGLGVLLVDVLFGYDAISTRIPIYAFVFLVALGVDYNIMLMSRFKEERKKHSLRKAVQISVSRTGNVITSAGLILAATFAVLMTQPIAELFVFGFIVALGILLDTLLVRGMLLPALIMLFERDDKVSR